MEDLPDQSDDAGMRFDMSDLPAGMEYITDYHPEYRNEPAFRFASLNPSAGERAWIRVQFDAPGPEHMKLTPNSTCGIVCTIDGGDIEGRFRESAMVMSVIYPDLTVISITFKGSTGEDPVDDENATAVVLVTNKGSHTSWNVKIDQRSVGSMVSSGRIARIDPGSAVTIELSFIASRNVLSFEIEIDPYNEIIESRDRFMDNGTDDNNRYSTSIEVREKEVGKKNRSTGSGQLPGSRLFLSRSGPDK